MKLSTIRIATPLGRSIMRIFPPPLEIQADEGFARDKLGRQPMGVGLTNLLSDVTDPLVIALDAEWGTGKSTFLRMWAADLKCAGFPVAFFDAFAHDYADDAFLALAGEVIALAEDKRRVLGASADALLRKAVGASKVLAKSAGKVAVRAVTLNVVNSNDFKELSDALADEASDVADKALEALLKGQAQKRDAIEAFRKALAELPRLLDDGKSETPKPLVFIIDELDRCRPQFALELLERIKHFFSVENVHFVLGVNLTQLQVSVRSAYGSDVDAVNYLQKFIHLSVTFPPEAQHLSARAVRRYIQHVRESIELQPGDPRNFDTILTILEHVAVRDRVSLRGIERIMSVLAVAFAFTPGNWTRMAPYIAGLAALKVLHPNLYRQARIGHLSFADASRALHLESTDIGDLNSNWLASAWRFATDPDLSQDHQDAHKDMMFYWRGERLEILPDLCRELFENLAPAAPR